MIIEYLQPDPSLADGLTVVARAIYYTQTLGAAGMVAFLALMGERLRPEEDAWTRRAILIAVLAGLAASSLSMGLRAVVLSTEGLSGLLRFDLYPAILESRIGDSLMLRVAGLVLILAALSRRSWGLPLAAAGAVLVVASYTAMGHSTLYRPRQELAALVGVHLAMVAFWAGSLLPLRYVIASGPPAHAARVVAEWSRVAIPVVAVLVAAGATAAWYLVGRWDLLVTSWYGWGLMAKLVAFAVLLGFAITHRLWLTRALAAGVPGAQRRLSRSIGLEIVVALAVFYAAAEMVSVHPVDYGHRIPAR